jgi:hypothetical protein
LKSSFQAVFQPSPRFFLREAAFVDRVVRGPRPAALLVLWWFMFASVAGFALLLSVGRLQWGTFVIELSLWV